MNKLENSKVWDRGYGAYKREYHFSQDLHPTTTLCVTKEEMRVSYKLGITYLATAEEGTEWEIKINDCVPLQDNKPVRLYNLSAILVQASAPDSFTIQAVVAGKVQGFGLAYYEGKGCTVVDKTPHVERMLHTHSSKIAAMKQKWNQTRAYETEEEKEAATQQVLGEVLDKHILNSVISKP